MWSSRCAIEGGPSRPDLETISACDTAEVIATSLLEGENGLSSSAMLPNSTAMPQAAGSGAGTLAAWGRRLASFGESANSVGGYVAGAYRR